MTKRFQWVYIKDGLVELRDNGIVKVFNNERLEELLNELSEENEELKRLNGKQQIEIECLSDELAQCKAVIDKRWNEYLESKGDKE